MKTPRIPFLLAAASLFAVAAISTLSSQNVSLSRITPAPSGAGSHRMADGKAFLPGYRSFDTGNARVNVDQLLITNISETQTAHVCVTLRDLCGAPIHDDGFSGSGGLLAGGCISNYTEPSTGPSACFDLAPLGTAGVGTDSRNPSWNFTSITTGSGEVEYTVSGGASGPILTASITHTFFRYSNEEESFWSYAVNGGQPF